MDNYLSAEQLIVDRLKAEVVGLAGVFSAADLDGVVDRQQIVPAAHVLYDGDRIADGAGRSSTGEKQKVEQLWYVVLAVRNARTASTGEAARADAGVLLLRILKALQGWRLSPEHDPMKRINGVNPGHASGFLYIPIRFSTTIFI
jgi:hypothetical protein